MEKHKTLNFGYIFIILTLFLGYQQHTDYFLVINKEKGNSIILHIREVSNPDQNTNFGIWVNYQKIENEIELKILKSTVSDRDFFAFFSTGRFAIPPGSAILLPGEDLIKLKPGNYEIRESSLFYEIKFD